MKFQLYQIIVSILAAVMIYQGAIKYLKGRAGQTFFKLLIRMIVWGGMALIAIFPNFTNFLAGIVGLESNINAVILTGFILIFLIIFKLLSAIERLEQQISEVNRKEALKSLQKKD
jgi:hypothetical protein